VPVFVGNNGRAVADDVIGGFGIHSIDSPSISTLIGAGTDIEKCVNGSSNTGACVGVVIRGQTPHFEHVAREAATGIREVALATGVPVTFGVITALSEEQAWDRAGGDVGNRGEEAAEAAVEMAEFIAKVHRG